MVKKLFKHEFLAWLRIVPLFLVISPLAATAYRILSYFEVDNLLYDMLNLLTLIVTFLSMIPCIAAPVVFGVTRFYKNLFTGEGYLTMTLPVKVSQHIWVKAIVNAVFTVVAILVLLLSLVIFIGTDILNDLWAELELIFLTAPNVVRQHLPLYILEVLVLLLVGAIGNPLQLYSCICLGQLSKKNRILAAVGAFFLYSFIAEIVTSCLSVGMTLLGGSKLLVAYGEFLVEHPFASIHVHMLGSLVLCLALYTAFFLICHHIMKKKLNLE